MAPKLSLPSTPPPPQSILVLLSDLFHHFHFCVYSHIRISCQIPLGCFDLYSLLYFCYFFLFPLPLMAVDAQDFSTFCHFLLGK